jgi:endonuclease/exonuclease/phosphatase family metal-dependent hydrolase
VRFLAWPRAHALLLILAAAAVACRSGEDTSTTTSAASTGSGGAGSGGAGGAGGMLPAPQLLAILDWNTHDFFDDVQDNATDTVLSATAFKKKVQTIGGVIKGLNPDVVMLAEIENQNVLDTLNTSALGGKYTSRKIFVGNDPRGINVALLSTIEPDEVISHAGDTFTKTGTPGPSYKYSRDCLEVHLTVNGRKLVLLGVHFKSKATPDDPDKRLAEAQHTRAIADALTAKDPTLGVLVLGDYNDESATAPWNAVAGKKPDLYSDATAQAPTADQYSYTFQKMHELIDHQLANPLLGKLLDPSKVIIKHGPGIDDDSTSASDHAPVLAVYQVR